ncbi:ABC transporter ATP-binding protein [Brevundimonas sp. GN22]|uniref:ABC transporter ATP-binding protein n=1 Tax=Brevundimonas pishanensis TaxID=2896315 RepID=UPI001FA76A74|nr:ABC transporter ATP-binding protein [Brevundimonas pishanensis]
MNAVISIERLTKSFGDVRALDGLSLEIPQGGVYGILGPNGAGKSTLFRILLGLIQPTSGHAQVMGYPLAHTETLRRIGSMIETPRYPAYLTARDSLQWLAAAHGQATQIDVDHWLERVGLKDAADRKVRGFSVGMMQRLGLAASLMTRPDLVILDEPTSGMDPPGIHEMRSLIRDLAENDGVTVILASHQLLEVQRICDRVAILNRGRLAAEGKVSDLTEATEYLHLEATPLAKVKEIIGDAAEIVGDAILVNIRREDTAGLIRHLVQQDVDVMEARWVGGDLEAVFMSETLGVPEAEVSAHVD